MFTPIRFGAWNRTLDALVQEIATGPGIVGLIGPEGCWKSCLLAFYSASANDRQVALRTPAEEPEADVVVDLVDDVSLDQAKLLVDPPPPGITRVLSLRPDAATALPGKVFALRTVLVEPLDESDVCTIIAARCRQAGTEPSIFSAPTTAHLIRSAGGSPKRVDKLVRETLQQTLNGAQIDAVGQAIRNASEATRSPMSHKLAASAVTSRPPSSEPIAALPRGVDELAATYPEQHASWRSLYLPT